MKIWLIFLMLAVWLVGVPATGQPVLLAGTEESAEDSWLTRILNRYFGHGGTATMPAEGKALEIVNQYLEFAGQPIEVVIVHQVLNFKDGWDQDQSYSTRTLNSLTQTMHTYTRDSVVRYYLLFERGQLLDPFALADSERMLRNLEYISDARIVLVPLEGETESVAVVVEIKDRWPFGVMAKVDTADKYSFKLYDTNVAGLGLRFSNQFLHCSVGNPKWGYQGILSKDNINGSFLNTELVYEDSFNRLQRKVMLERRLTHPGIDHLGGILFDQVQRRDLLTANKISRSKYEFSEIWLGRTVRLFDSRQRQTTARTVIVPAVAIYRKIYTDRPVISLDVNRQYHNRQAILAGLTFSRQKSYKTNYLFLDGEMEDIPSGLVLKGVVGYEIREFQERSTVAWESMAISIRNRGDILYGRLDIGGYLNKGKMEEGALVCGGGYFSPLFGQGRYRHRFYLSTLYTLGLGRYPFDRIYLDDRAGIRGLAQSVVRGNQRIVGHLEYRLFTPISVLGFRLSLQAFSDLGLIAGENEALFKKKIYTSSGLGFRLRNPDLVLPTVQLRLGLLSNIDNSGVSFSVKIGNVGGANLQLPGVKPSILGYY